MLKAIWNWLIGDYPKKPKKSKITVNGITIPDVDDVGDLLFIVSNGEETFKFNIVKERKIKWLE
jgi:hypothetical protein